MLAYIMDFDPRITSGGEDLNYLNFGTGDMELPDISDTCSYPAGHEWHCNFHFGYGHDVIEDAKNEKFCVQALQYLIAKADAEICDLEDELAIHQCQLKWAETDENRNPYEDCCATFKKKIDLLTKSIKNARNRSSLDEHDTDTSVRIQRPAERICDIISALVKHKFSAPNEQVEDLSNGMLPITSGLIDNGTDLKQTETTPESAESKHYLELMADIESLHKVEDLSNGIPPITSGSVDNGTDLKQTETTPESAESKELMTDVESLYKHVDTISEESCSDTVKYAIRDPVEARDVSKIVVKGTGKIEVDAYECTPEAIIGFIGDSKVYNNSGEESEECMTGSKFSGSGSSSLFAKAKVAVKVEEDNYDTSIQHTAADSGCKMQDHVSECPLEAHQVVEGNQSPSVDDFQITYERKKPGLSSIRKTQRQKLQRKHSSGSGQLTLGQMQKRLGKIGKRQFPPNLDDPQSNSPSSEAEKFSSVPESVGHTVNIAHGIHPGVLGSKKHKLLKASREDASIQSQEVELSKDEDICASEDLASQSKSELVMCLQSPCLVEGKDSNLANLHNGGKKNAEDANIKVSPAYDLESLKLKLSQEPDFINKMKAPDLKEILKSHKVRGFSKFKKEKMIEEVNKLLKAT